MRVKELIKLIDAPFTIVSANGNHDSESTIPEELMNSMVNSIKMDKVGIIIILDYSRKPQTLEELGYSFEVGV